MTAFMRIVFLSAEVLVAAAVLYLFVLAVAAIVGERRMRRRLVLMGSRNRFLVLVPAHDEEETLGSLLGSIATADYPSKLVDVAVIADNCTDRTAAVARAAGVECLERSDTEATGKGHALDWAMRLLAEQGGRGCDAFVILDADSVIEPGFFAALDRELQGRPGILQAHYAVLNPRQTAFTAISTLAFSLQQYVKPLGRRVLGLSPRLLGNGMAFPASLLAEGWGATSISEDLNYFVELLLRGHRTRLVPDAVVRAEMPATRGMARSQRVRWEKGRMLALREQVPRLLGASLRRRDIVLADAAFDIAIPPFTVLTTEVLAIGALGTWVPALRPAFSVQMWTWVLLLLVVYVMTGAYLVRLSPALLAKSILTAPVFLVWKLWIQAVALVGLRDRRWVRTPRGSEWEGGS